jgi:hypothetical protein
MSDLPFDCKGCSYQNEVTGSRGKIELSSNFRHTAGILRAYMGM